MTAFAELADCRLAYERRGSGPALVFIHGFGLDRRLWDPQFAHLDGRGELVRYDCRGFGESSGSLEGEYRHGADLEALLDHLGIERATLVGMSMGGQIALETAVLRPERVERLVLVDAFLADFEFSEAWRGMWRALAKLARSQGLEAAKQTWREGMLFRMEERFPEAARALGEMMESWSGWHLAHPDHYPYRSISARLSEVSAPALVAVGELDLPDFQAIADRIAGRLPRAERAVIPGAGHVPCLETPAAFHRALDAFLARA
jgi:pimeloyl-ACP methyl ester carboxylesterase